MAVTQMRTATRYLMMTEKKKMKMSVVFAGITNPCGQVFVRNVHNVLNVVFAGISTDECLEPLIKGL